MMAGAAGLSCHTEGPNPATPPLPWRRFYQASPLSRSAATVSSNLVAAFHFMSASVLTRILTAPALEPRGPRSAKTQRALANVAALAVASLRQRISSGCSGCGRVVPAGLPRPLTAVGPGSWTAAATELC